MITVKIPDSIMCVIPARMASSRFYGKPLADILGKPMLQWVYEACRESILGSKVTVATDHTDIENFCRSAGIPVMMTSPEHRNCSERSAEVCRWVGTDYIVEIQGDEPLILPAEINEFVKGAFSIEDFDIVTQYTDITAEQAENPHHVKVVLGLESRALFFTRSSLPYNFKNRPHISRYKQVGLFCWKAGSIQRFADTPVSELEKVEDTHMLRLIENGFDVRLVYTPKFAVSVDMPEDIFLAEESLRQRFNVVGVGANQ